MAIALSREEALEAAESASRGAPNQKGAGLSQEINPGPELGKAVTP